MHTLKVWDEERDILDLGNLILILNRTRLYEQSAKIHSDCGGNLTKIACPSPPVVYTGPCHSGERSLNAGEFGGQRLLSEPTRKQMLAKQYPQFPGPVENLWGSKDAGFGLTWWVDERDGELYFAHSGSVPGYTAFLLGNRTRNSASPF